MTSANRDPSPIVKYEKRKTAMILEPNKIHRIRLLSPAYCSVANVVSPSCIWFKLTNHISSELQYVKPSPLQQLVGSSVDEETGVPTSIQIYDYVMAPWKENIYARGRVLNLKKAKNGNEYVYIHFIDEGSAHWMNVNCLAKMEEVLYTQPWQAIPVSLFKLSPALDIRIMKTPDYWSSNVIQLLESIMAEYQFFCIVPIHDSRRLNSYHEYIRADIFGLIDLNDKIGDSIAHRLSLELFASQDGVVTKSNFFHRSWYDAREQNLIPIKMNPFNEEMALGLPGWRVKFPENFSDGLQSHLLDTTKTKSKEDDVVENEQFLIKKMETLRLEWDPENTADSYPCVSSASINYLTDKKYLEDKKCTICIEWKSVQSPNEFYAFPTIKKDENPLQNLYEEQLKWASTLDSFYGRPSNRKPIVSSIVMKMLRNKKRSQIYAIYEFNDEVISGSYRRVQILAVRNPNAVDYSNEFCRIRFLDVGGNDIVPLAGLIAIHSSHCKRPPMCLQLSLATKFKGNDSFWSENCCQTFRMLARSDMPIQCKIEDQVPASSEVLYNSPPQTWPEVFIVSSLRVEESEISLEEELFKLVSSKKNFKI